jgi:hypothetical protein
MVSKLRFTYSFLPDFTALNLAIILLLKIESWKMTLRWKNPIQWFSDQRTFRKLTEVIKFVVAFS